MSTEKGLEKRLINGWKKMENEVKNQVNSDDKISVLMEWPDEVA